MDEERPRRLPPRRGGRLFVALDPRTNSSLEPLLKAWGAEAGDSIVVDPESAQRLIFLSPLRPPRRQLRVPRDHRPDEGAGDLLRRARSVSPEASNRGLSRPDPAADLSVGMGETDFTDETFRFDEGRTRRVRSPSASRSRRTGEGRRRPGQRVPAGGGRRLGFHHEREDRHDGQRHPAPQHRQLAHQQGESDRHRPQDAGADARPAQRRADAQHLLAVRGAAVFGLLLGVVVWWRQRR